VTSGSTTASAEISALAVVEPDVTLPLIQYLYRECIERGVDGLLIACVASHSRFYQRMIGFSPFATFQQYGEIHQAGDALFLDLAWYRPNGGRFPLHTYLESGVAAPMSTLEKAS